MANPGANAAGVAATTFPIVSLGRSQFPRGMKSTLLTTTFPISFARVRLFIGFQHRLYGLTQFFYSVGFVYDVLHAQSQSSLA